MNQRDSEHTIPADETDWLAVRYVLGELAPADAETFEHRLADDQDARDAVVRATQLVASLGAARDAGAVVRPKRSRIRTAAAVLAATAAAIAIAAVVLRTAQPPERPRLAVDDVDPDRLVVLWSASSEEADEGDQSELATNADGDADLLPPDWMLAAVEQEALSGANDSPLDPETDEIERN